MQNLADWLGKSFNRNITSFISRFKLGGAFCKRRRIELLGLFFFLVAEVAGAAFERTPQPPRVVARAASPSYIADASSFLLNPSVLASTPLFSITAFYSPSPFELPQLSCGGVFVTMPAISWAGALAVTTSGFSLYRELCMTASLATSLEEGFFLGSNLNVNHLTIRQYGTASAVGIDLGGSARLAEDLWWGVSILNINRPTIGNMKDDLPQVYLTGLSCEVLAGSSVSLHVIKDVRYPVSVRVGTEFSFYGVCDVRLGFSTEPSRYFAGIGFRYVSLSADYSVGTHLDLGLTHTFGISFAP